MKFVLTDTVFYLFFLYLYSDNNSSNQLSTNAESVSSTNTMPNKNDITNESTSLKQTDLHQKQSKSSSSISSSSSSISDKIFAIIFNPTIAVCIGILQRIILFFWGLYQDATIEPRFTDIDYFVFTDASRFMVQGGPPAREDLQSLLISSIPSSLMSFLNTSLASPNNNNPYSPYLRETYRYTPILAWLLIPSHTIYFGFGKILFAFGDIVAGILILKTLQIIRLKYCIQQRQEEDGKINHDNTTASLPDGRNEKWNNSFLFSERAIIIYTCCVWLFNPMVSIISTRGSSEGLLGAIVMVFVYLVYTNHVFLAGIVAGFAVHFKIYPLIYIPTVIWAMSSNNLSLSSSTNRKNKINNRRNSIFPQSIVKSLPILNFVNRDRVVFAGASLASFLLFTGWMYALYGPEFLVHTYFHHLSRLDHRHNFSPYSTLLYMSSSPAATAQNQQHSSSILSWMENHPASSWAFFPQLMLSGVLIPLAFAKRDVAQTMFLQTFAFVTFNKVCTAQYFMWYLVLLPFYLPRLITYLRSNNNKNKNNNGSAVRATVVGLVMIALWAGGQALWVRQGYLLEFLGVPTFYPGLFAATLIFFSVNCLILGIFIKAM